MSDLHLKAQNAFNEAWEEDLSNAIYELQGNQHKEKLLWGEVVVPLTPKVSATIQD